MIWKFLFWPVVWITIFLPGWIWPLSLSGIFRWITLVVGLIIFIMAILLAAIGGKTLKHFAHQDGHQTFWPDKFTAAGIFSCMRHPMHLGLALFPVGIALIWGSIPVILASGWGVVAALWFVLVVEEKETLHHFGDEYSRYMQQTPPFTLSPTCLKKGYAAIKHSGD